MSDKPCSRENGFRVDCIKHYAEVEAENARLKADAQVLLKHLVDASADSARHKAEVERLVEGLNDQGAALLRLSFENERLRKAGDAMADILTNFERSCYGKPSIEAEAWNAAKEGKPQS